MNHSLKPLLDSNRAWAKGITTTDPGFFQKLSQQQSPAYLWIGCADSRVPANEIVGLMPGELFVHRNVSNLVVHTDLNCLSVIQYAVEVLKVKHIIVCGHYGCGGILAALKGSRLGLIDNWLRHVQDVAQRHADVLSSIHHESNRGDRLCELNVIEQAINVAQTTIVREAWARSQQLFVHGLIYGLKDGLLRDLHVTISDVENETEIYKRALAMTAV